MATYNGGKFIREQIDSIIGQMSEEDELIISDDGSTDDTLDIIRSYNDSRIRVFNHTINKVGLSNSDLIGKNFEFLLRKAKGDYIYISDQDDIWMPDKLKIMNDLLKTKDVVICNGVYIGDKGYNGALLYKSFIYKNYFLRRPTYFGCCTAFNSKMLTKILPFPKKMPIYDHWIGLICEYYGSCSFIDIPLIKHRLHSNNASSKSNFSFFYKVYYRIRFMKDFFLRLVNG